ncbi:LuxR C-terminal-related transcriptional regulator [Comamonas sp. C24C]
MPDLPQILSTTQLSAPPYALVVDDHPLVAEGMAQVLMTSAGVRQVRCAAHGNEALAVIAALGEPVITVMDFWLEDGASLEFVHSILALAPGTRILVTSGDKHPAIVNKAAAAGVHGFVHKSSTAQVFQMAVQALLSGRSWFEALPPIPAAPPASAAGSTLHMSARELGITARQSQVLSLLLQGKPNRAIAQTLNLSEYTVKEHVTALLQRLGASNRVALITRMRGIEVDLD